jgi:hypothetical protein
MDNEQRALLNYLKTATPTEAAQRAGDEALKRALLDKQPERQPIDPYSRAMLPTSRRFNAHDLELARFHAKTWREWGFSIDEAQTWLRCGVEPHECMLAVDCVEEGITPARLSDVLEHPDTGERLSLLALLHRFYGRWPYHDGLRNLVTYLDDLGIERTRRPRPIRQELADPMNERRSTG